MKRSTASYRFVLYKATQKRPSLEKRYKEIRTHNHSLIGGKDNNVSIFEVGYLLEIGSLDEQIKGNKA